MNMDPQSVTQQIWSQLGVYAVTVVILLAVSWVVWQAFRAMQKEIVDTLKTVVINNTQAMKDNKDSTDALIERFDDFVRNGHKRR